MALAVNLACSEILCIYAGQYRLDILYNTLSTTTESSRIMPAFNYHLYVTIHQQFLSSSCSPTFRLMFYKMSSKWLVIYIILYPSSLIKLVIPILLATFISQFRLRLSACYALSFGQSGPDQVTVNSEDM